MMDKNIAMVVLIFIAIVMLFKMDIVEGGRSIKISKEKVDDQLMNYPHIPSPQVLGSPNIPGFPNIPSFPNIPGFPNISGFPNIPGFPHIPYIPGFPNNPCFPNIPGFPLPNPGSRGPNKHVGSPP